MKNVLPKVRLLAGILFFTGLDLFIYVSYIFIRNIDYADAYNTSGAMTNLEYILFALSALTIILGSAAFFFFLGLKETTVPLWQLCKERKKEIPRVISLGAIIFVILFTKAVILLIVLYFLMKDKEIKIIKEWYTKRKNNR